MSCAFLKLFSTRGDAYPLATNQDRSRCQVPTQASFSAKARIDIKRLSASVIRGSAPLSR
jgi:hypothetical protein